jgi:tetratricopeptide (TPR) repeat protein
MARELNKSTVLLCLLLAAVTLAVYWPVGRYEFVDYDDGVYVVENPRVRAGLTPTGIVWAFARLTGDGTYWHPVTWLSHMLDCQLYGPRPGPHHLVNLGFHIANALLLFLVLGRLTRAVWRSAAVAALFALHPWQVETVAWVAERKNVLSTFFFLLTLWAYGRYARKSEGRRPKAEVQGGPSVTSDQWPVISGEARGVSATDHRILKTDYQPGDTRHLALFYLLSLCCFALGLMSKPMLVTLPFVLLLLDYWPLRRLGGRADARSGVTPYTSTSRFTFHVSRFTVRVVLEKLPFLAMSGVMVWVTMAGHHRFSLDATWPSAPLAARLANGLVSYVRYIAGTFWPGKLAVLYPFPVHWPVALVAGAGLLLAGLSVWAVWELRRRPYLAVGWFWFLGTLVPVIGVVQDGAQAMADRYMYVPLIGLLLALCWGAADILDWLRRPAWAVGLATLVILGCIWGTRHQLQFWQNSLALFGRTVAVTRNNYIMEEDLGVALARTGALEEARARFDEALRINPEHPNAHFNRGLWLALEGKPAEAAVQYREAIRLRPNYAKALNNLAWLMATDPDPHGTNDEEALRLARRAADLTEGNDPGTLDTLAAACAEAHRFEEAAAIAERAVALAETSGQSQLARQIQARLEGYRSEKPYHEP